MAKRKLLNSANDGIPIDGSVTNASVATDADIDAAKLGTGDVSNTEFNYLNGVTSPIQTQLDGKQPLIDDLAIPTATVAADDKVLIQDTDDNDELKTVTAQAIADLAAGGVTSVNGDSGTVIVDLESANDESTISAVTPVVDDKFIYRDASDSDNLKTATLAQIAALSGINEVAWTPVTTFVTNTTWVARYLEHGNHGISGWKTFEAQATFAGAPNSGTFECDLPAGMTFDTVITHGDDLLPMGFGTMLDTGVNNYTPMIVRKRSSTKIGLNYSTDASGALALNGDVAHNAPHTIGNTDAFMFRFSAYVTVA